jgi:hypothetical protein
VAEKIAEGRATRHQIMSGVKVLRGTRANADDEVADCLEITQQRGFALPAIQHRGVGPTLGPEQPPPRRLFSVIPCQGRRAAGRMMEHKS